jgi:RNA polymerase sigma-70 factor (ECF subfamily)
MLEPKESTTHILRRLPCGGRSVRNGLLRHACDRLLRLTGQMLRDYPAVGRWEQAEDVLQNALVRLDRDLQARPFESSRHFWSAAAQKIRWELIDLARHYHGPQGQGARHHTDHAGRAADDPGGPLRTRADGTGEPATLAEWAEFHERVASLPDEQREVFDLLWYGEVSQEAAARMLRVPLRTLKRRWLQARLGLRQRLRAGLPGPEGGR